MLAQLTTAATTMLVFTLGGPCLEEPNSARLHNVDRRASGYPRGERHRKITPNGEAEFVRVPAPGQSWRYAKHDFVTGAVIDRLVDRVLRGWPEHRNRLAVGNNQRRANYLSGLGHELVAEIPWAEEVRWPFL